MGWRRRVARASLTAALACASVLAGLSVAYADNATCLVCHEATTEFEVGPVNRDTACIACHNAGMVGTHPFHQAGANCGAYCHPSWGQSLLTAVPNYTDPTSGATFASLTSKNTDSAVLHIIHANPRWTAGVDTAASRCASCHAVADCDACHQSMPASAHANHSSTVQSPWSGLVGHGVVAGDQTIYSAVSESNYCATAGCHDIAGTTDNTPRVREDFSHPASAEYGLPENIVTATPSIAAWKTSYKPVYTLGRMSYSNYVNAGLAITFTGESVALVADKDPYRGIAQVWIDGALVANVDLYAPTTTNQVVVFESGLLASGSHTIQVRSTGAKNPSARYNFVTVDCFRVYETLPDSIAPDCTESCHADKASGHGASFSHEASLTVGTYPSGRFECTACHNLQLTGEHTRVSSKTRAAGCAACHMVYAPYALDTYDYGCNWNTYGSGCHQASNGEEPHNFTDSNHDSSAVAGTSECRSCHGDDIAVIHDDQNAARPAHGALSGNAWTTDCLTCHGPNKFPVTKDCTASGCHVGSGVVDMLSHPAPAHDASGADSGVARTGGNPCSTCHLLELTSEHGKPLSVTDPGATEIGCGTCHSAPYFPVGWLDTPPTSNTCVACHPIAGGSAGAGHELADFSVKHDWDPPFGNSASCGDAAGIYCHGGTRAWLGDIEMVDLLHDVAKPGSANCTSCHDSNVAVPAETACSDCHTAHAATTVAHNASSAAVPANASCLGCHASYANAHLAHAGGCVGCHENAALNSAGTRYLSGALGMQCTGCHTDGVLGTVYDPTDPNHYLPATHTANIAADTVATGGSVVTTKACTACHAVELKVEHALTLSAGNVGCIGCHSSVAPVNGSAQVAADWTNELCSDCHGVNHGGVGQAAHDLGDASCAGVDCHANTNDLALVHADADTGSATSCNVCHTSADTSLATKTTCAGASGCHTSHDMSVHVSSASGECVACHENADVRPVHPGGCVTCHGNGSYPTLPGANSAECLQCHGDEVGAGAYSPTDPNHYDSATHTAIAQAGTYAGFACTQCHSLEMKPEHITKGSSAFSTVPGTHGDKCIACHEIEVDSLGAWNDTCAPCHTSNHTAQATKHDASAVAAGCGGGGCHDVTDVSAIHDNSVTSNATVTTCATCHVDNTAVPADIACGTAGCHDGMSAHSHDLSVAASDYNNTTVTGCTNSGAGCHGTDASANYQAYHVAAGCLAGGCHTSADQADPAFDNPNSCLDCHADGAYENAADTVGLAVAAPNGHYSESLHAASALGATVSAGGSTSAACTVCHNPANAGGIDGLWFQHQGLQMLGATTCADCHNYSAGVTAEVDASWTGDACADCHNATALPGLAQHPTSVGVAAGSSADGCIASGCHASDLHATHKGDGVGGDPACTVCHDGTKQGWKPTATTCGASGACHTSGYHASFTVAHTATTSSACVDCHENANISTVHGGACATCHGNVSYPTLPGTSAECVDCHKSGLAEETHDISGNYVPYDPNHYVGTEAIHTASSQGGTYDGFACTQCHSLEMKPEHITKASSAFSTIPGTHADKCVACHEIEVDSLGAWNDTCAPCHATTHTARAAKHDATGVGNADSCAGGGCHAVGDVSAIHADSITTNAMTPDCASCHADSTAVPTALSCDTTGCHAGLASHDAAHETASSTACVQCHEYSSAMEQHAPTVIGALVSGKTNDGCNICHGGDGWASVRASVSDPECTTCHNGTVVGAHIYSPYDPNHYAPASAQHTADGVEAGIANIGGKTCVTCHQLEMKPEHAKASTSFGLGGYADRCVACHELQVDGLGGAWSDDCQACHAVATVHTAAGFGVAHDFAGYAAANSASCGGANCHNVVLADVVHATSLPGAGDCTSCHDSNAAVPTEHLCSDCHTASPHNMAAAHDGSAGTIAANADCVTCHAAYADLTAHSGACAACHQNATLSDYLNDNYTAQCTGCHTAGVLGTVYDPTDPNHYVLANHTSVAPVNGSAQVAADWTNDLCSDCHGANHGGTGQATHDLGDASCAGVDCHANTNDLALIHADADTGSVTSCNVCHTSADTSLATKTTCAGASGCHTAHDLSVHVSSVSSECVDCHGAADIRTEHAGCSTCHGNGSYPTLPGANSSECTQCHGDEVGAGAYSPVDPSHYSATLHTSAIQGAQTYSLNGQTNACQACHDVELKPEHSRTTSAMGGTGSVCVKCHTQSAAATVVSADWSTDTCAACHGVGAIPARHLGVGSHTAASTGCSSTGAGCHNTDDLARVGTDKTTNIHNTCLRCHDKTASAPNLAYDPAKKTCGSGRACHAAAGQYDTTTFVHNGGGGLADGTDAAHHTADGSMAATLGAYGNDNTCSTCHSAGLTSAHSTAGWGSPSCQTCHNATAPVNAAGIVKSSWATRDCVECHNSAPTYHNTYTLATHTATLGAAGANGCAAGGCHGTTDVRAIHDTAATGCANSACHAQNKGMSGVAMSCGEGSLGCHTDKTNANHGPDHNYTAVSAYADGSGEGVEAGCANSGNGCHASASAGDAVATFHAAGAVSCLTSACHTSPSMTAGWKAANTGAECAACHSGTFTNAVDTTPLATLTPSGHYNNALHTATAGLGSVSAGGSASASCATCHDLSLKDAHQAAGFSSKTKGAKVTCAECHGYNAALASEVKTLSWQNKHCADCHNSSDMGASQAMHSATTAPTVSGSSTAGCGAAGNGCHNTYNLHDLHKNRGCTLAGCHDATDKDMTAAVRTCGQASGCHTSATYAASSHNGLTGDDVTKHRAAGNAAASIGGYTQSTACVNCHTLTLKTAHTTRAGWTSPYCSNCHNTTTPLNATDVIKATAWNNGTCEACHTAKHNTYTAGEHASTAGSGCTIGACHGASGGSADVRTIHDRVTAGCSVTGTDSQGWSGGCHALDKQMTTTAMSCGTGATGLACHTSHTHTNHGGSPGGISCNTSGCHTALNGMVNDTTTYHHVLDSATPYRAPNGGTYPTSTTAMECVSCHLDHSEYSALPGGPGKAYSLRNSATVANPTRTNTDDTLCLSCHTANVARNTTGQKANVITETMVWDVPTNYWNGVVGAISPHNYDAPGPFNDGSIFYANCAKCHGSLTGTLSSGKFSVHFSAEQRLLNALGDTINTASIVNEEQMCFRCHSKTTDFTVNGGTMPGTPKLRSDYDWYDTQVMGEANVVIYSQMRSGANTAGHKPHLYQNKHLLDEADETQAYINANKHVECADCHNHHAVGNARHEWGTTNTVSEALRGVTGQGYRTGGLAALATINSPTTAQVNAQLSWKSESAYEYEICFKCHSSANTNLTTWGGTKTGATSQSRWTNVAADFNVGNQSRHPVLAPNDAYTDTTTYGTSKVFAGQLVDIWAPGDTMYCSDCHGDSTAPLYSDPDALNHAQGPHGSAVQFSLRGPNTDWPINSRTGQLFTLNDVYGGDKPFCMNCHPNVGANKVHARNTTHKARACVNCHILIPHGGGMSRLMGDGDGAMPARYAYNNDKNTMWIASFIKRSDPNTYAKADCRVTTAGQSACGSGHSTGSSTTSPFENW